MSPIMTPTARLLSCLAVVVPMAVHAQASLTTTTGGTAVYPREASFLSIEFGDSKVGLRSYRERTVRDTAPVQSVCGSSVPKIADHMETAVELALSATKGKRSLISGGKPVPGAEASVTISRFFEGGIVEPLKCAGDEDLDLDTRGYRAVFGGVRGEWLRRPQYLAGSPITTQDQGSFVVLGVLGYNHAWTERTVAGLSIEAGREFNSSAEAKPQSVCTVVATGLNDKGQVVNAQTCEDRYAGPLADYTIGTVRLDFITKLATRADGPSTGLIVGASVTSRSGLSPVYSVAIGPSVHPTGSPSRVIGAALLEYNDITNANGRNPEPRDRVHLKLFVGLPW